MSLLLLYGSGGGGPAPTPTGLYITTRVHAEGSGYLQPVGYYRFGTSAPRTRTRQYNFTRSKKLIIVPTNPPAPGGLSIQIAAYHYNHHLSSMQ